MGWAESTVSHERAHMVGVTWGAAGHEKPYRLDALAFTSDFLLNTEKYHLIPGA